MQANLGPPCLSLDVIPDDLGNDRTNYPLTLYGVAGSQAQKAGANSIIVFKMYNLHATKRKNSDKNNDDSDILDIIPINTGFGNTAGTTILDKKYFFPIKLDKLRIKLSAINGNELSKFSLVFRLTIINNLNLLK